jgi:hypothetical protein
VTKIISKAYLFFLVLFLSSSILAGGVDGKVEKEEDLRAFIMTAVELLSKEKLEIIDLEKMLSSRAKLSENKKFWFLESPSLAIRVTAEITERDKKVIGLRIHPNRIDQLNLNDLKGLFGNYRVIMSSKTTWIEFKKIQTEPNNFISISAQLHYPPENAKSPVLTLALRME